MIVNFIPLLVWMLGMAAILIFGTTGDESDEAQRGACVLYVLGSALWIAIGIFCCSQAAT